MRTGIRITSQSIHLLADEIDVSAEEFHNEMVDAKLSLRREQQKRWAYEFFGKDEAWYNETMKKVQEIRASLLEDINPKVSTIEQYGWITKNGKKELSMPFIGSVTNTLCRHLDSARKRRN